MQDEQREGLGLERRMTEASSLCPSTHRPCPPPNPCPRFVRGCVGAWACGLGRRKVCGRVVLCVARVGHVYDAEAGRGKEAPQERAMMFWRRDCAKAARKGKLALAKL